MIAEHSCVTSLRMRKLHKHKDNNAAVLLAVCMLRALSGKGFTCHKIFNEYKYQHTQNDKRVT
jgi:hypothetical protein